MLDDVDETTVAGGVVVAAAAVLFRWPLSFTGLVVAAGLVGGLIVGLRLDAYDSPVYQGGVAGAVGAVGYGAVLVAVGSSSGLWSASEFAAPAGVEGAVAALTEAAGMAVLLVFGAVVGALVGDRLSASDADERRATDDGPTLRSGRTSDAAREREP